jgi:hypothetical protein
VCGDPARAYRAGAEAIRTIISIPASRRMMLGRLTGVGVAYPHRSSHDHAWAGRRMPDLACAGGRLYELMRDAA